MLRIVELHCYVLSVPVLCCAVLCTIVQRSLALHILTSSHSSASMHVIHDEKATPHQIMMQCEPNKQQCPSQSIVVGIEMAARPVPHTAQARAALTANAMGSLSGRQAKRWIRAPVAS